MRSTLRFVFTLALLSGATTPARADVVFYFSNPGALQPEENLLFNDASLVLTGLTVQGLTNQTATLIDISGQETLIADGGQAKVTATDTGFTWMTIAADDPGTLFGQFEANLKVYSPPGPPPAGTVTVSVTNNFGATETQNYSVSGGQNYFSLLAVDPQLIRSVLITSTIVLSEIEQIRLGDVQSEVVTIPEPGTLALFGIGLAALSRRLRQTARHRIIADRQSSMTIVNRQ